MTRARRITIDDLIVARAAAAPVRAVMLDVRDTFEVDRDRIPGAVNLPRHRIEFRIDTLVRDRATPLVVLDGGKADPRADLAAETLRHLGYADVAVLDGGAAAWRGGGLPVVCGINVSSRAFRERLKCTGEVQCVDVDTLLAWRREGTRVALIDVRTPAEHTQGCIPGAVSITGFEIASQGVDIAAESDVIVAYSGGCTRSIVSARTLGLLGVKDVVALDGGLVAWQLAGLEVERGSRRTRFTASVGSRQFGELGAARIAKIRGVRGIGAGELAQMLAGPARNVAVIDLRERAAFEAGHIAGTTSLPADAAILHSDDFIAVRTEPLVIVGDSEMHARLAAVWQVRLGSTDVAVLDGGIASWLADGRPLVAGRVRPSGWSGIVGDGDGVDAAAASAWLAARPDARVLQVDAGARFREGHLPGATWLPRGWLETRIDGVVPDPATPLLLTCASGEQAPLAAATLRNRGRVEVAWLAGGTRAWTAAGGAIETAGLELQEHELVPPIDRDEKAMRRYLDWAGSSRD